MKPTHRYIQPGDSEKVKSIAFSLAELKTLQSMVLEAMQQDATENTIYESRRELAEKLEYWITDFE